MNGHGKTNLSEGDVDGACKNFFAMVKYSLFATRNDRLVRDLHQIFKGRSPIKITEIDFPRRANEPMRFIAVLLGFCVMYQ